ncbi:unnamed protein product [Chrysoparadoxa australica]
MYLTLLTRGCYLILSFCSQVHMKMGKGNLSQSKQAAMLKRMEEARLAALREEKGKEAAEESAAPVRTAEAEERAKYKAFQGMLEGNTGFEDRDDINMDEELAVGALSSNTVKALRDPDLPPLRVGDFAPMDCWTELTNTEGEKVAFTLFQGELPILVVADPRGSMLTQVVIEMNSRFPRQIANLAIISPEPHGQLRKLAKRHRVTGMHLLSDKDKAWMKAYRVSTRTPWTNVAMVLDGRTGQIKRVLSDMDALAIVDVLKQQIRKL